MKTASYISRWGHLLVACSVVGLLFAAAAHTASAEEQFKRPKKKSQQGASDRSVTPMRVIVTADLPRDPAALPAWHGRPPMALDSSGTPRAADEPRFVTGSYIKQRFDIYGGVATTPLNLRVSSQIDLRRGGFLPGGSGRVSELGASATELLDRTDQERYVLDLRKVPAGRRLEVATQLLGPERGRRLVAEFNRWQEIHRIN